MNAYDPNYVYTPYFFSVGVKALVIGPSKRILVMRRSDLISRPGTWELPGGSVDAQEDPSEACIREIKEEAGLEAYAVQPIMTHTYAPIKGIGERNAIIIGYRAYVPSEDVALSWEHTEYEWVELEELKKLHLHPLQQRILDAYHESIGIPA